MNIEITKERDRAGWVEGTADNYWFQAKVADKPTSSGINEGKVFKLAICEDSDEYDYDKQVYNYSRGLDIDGVDRDVLDSIVEFLEDTYGIDDHSEEVSNIEDIEHLDLNVKLYINEYDKVLAVLFVNGYPNVLHDINKKEELAGSWSKVNIYFNTYTINIYKHFDVHSEDREHNYRALMYGIEESAEGPINANQQDFLMLDVEVVTNAHLNQPTKKMGKQ